MDLQTVRWKYDAQDAGLLVRNLTEADQSVYRCLGTNQGGNRSQSAELTVLGRRITKPESKNEAGLLNLPVARKDCVICVDCRVGERFSKRETNFFH